MKKKFGIYAWPAYATKESNPYNYLVYNFIEKQGHPVYEFNFKINLLAKLIFSSHCKILHLHWPRRDLLTSNSRIKSWVTIVIFFFFIKTIKFFGKRIVWTVHNIEAHEDKFPYLQKFITRLLYSNVDGFITMNEIGVELIKGNVKYLNKQKIIFIPHPHFKTYYLDKISKEEARGKLKIPPDRFVFLFLGLIKPYKNLPALINAFDCMNTEKKLLLIAGKLTKDLKYLEKILEDTLDIVFYDSFVKDDDLQIYLNAADVLVVPYRKVFNSGSVFLNLSFNKPTLAPNKGAFPELKLHFGSQWIKTYEGEISAEILEKTMNEVIEEKKELKKPDLEKFDPELVALKTLTFYESLLN